MKKCAVKSCGITSYRQEENVTFLSFPKNSQMRKKWIKVLKLDEQNIKKTISICSKHFKPKDFKNVKSSRKLVWPSVVPTLNLDIDKETKEKSKIVQDQSVVQTADVSNSSAPTIQLLELKIDIDAGEGSSHSYYLSPLESPESESSSVKVTTTQNVDDFPPPRKMIKLTLQENEFVEDSRRLEAEMEDTLEQEETVVRNLIKQVVQLEKENKSLRKKSDSFSKEFANMKKQLAATQRERDNMKTYLRQLEQKNDNLERTHRILSESIAGFKMMLDKAYETNALLEIEVDEKEVLQEK